MMQYSAYCMPDDDGKVGLCIMLEGFDTPEAAEWFLRELMAPFEDETFFDAETMH